MRIDGGTRRILGPCRTASYEDTSTDGDVEQVATGNEFKIEWATMYIAECQALVL